MADRLSELLRQRALPPDHFLYEDEQNALRQRAYRDVYGKDGPIQQEILPMNLADLAFTAGAPLIEESGLGSVLAGAGVAGLMVPGLRRLAKHPEAQRLLRDETGTSNLSALAGIFAPKGGATRGQTSKELRSMQRAELDPRMLEKADGIARANSEFRAALPFMTPGEVGQLVSHGPSVDKFSRLLSQLPEAAHVAAVAKAGTPKQGWYRASTQGLIDVFGKEDAPRFAALLAATSPQNSVEMNLQNTLNIWKNWTAAGRPTSAEAIKEVMAKSVQGSKGADSVLPAWVNNSVTALSTPDPRNIELSGFKVNSFFRNLSDDVNAVTNDAWMSNALGIRQKHFDSPAGYSAVSARMRQGAQKAGMFPSEGQETVWSVAMPLFEGAVSAGMHPKEFLDKGLLTPELVRGTPDFSTLLKQPEYRRILDQSGYGEALDRMQSYKWPDKFPELSSTEQQYLDKTAGVLGDLRQDRLRETRSRSFPAGDTRPETAFATRTQEYVPYTHANHLSGLVDAPFSQRSAYTSKVNSILQDLKGRDLFHSELGLSPIENRAMTGLYEPPNAPREINPGVALGTEVPIRRIGEPDLYTGDRRKLDGAAALTGGITVQGGSPWNAAIPHENGPSIFVPLEGKIPEQRMLAASGVKRPDMAIADTGGGAHVFSFEGKPITDEEAGAISSLLGNPEYKRATPQSGYVGFEDEWVHPGQGKVTNKMLGYLDALGQPDYRRLDAAVREPAGRLSDLYSTTSQSRQEPVREDVMNMLKILRTEGLDGLKSALKAGRVALPVGVGALSALPSLRGTGQQSEAN